MNVPTDRLPEVTVRFVRAGVYDDVVMANRARATLGAEERGALDRQRHPATRRDALAAHALARAMLARRAGCPPSEIRLAATPRGRLVVLMPRPARGLRFSLSHADGIALCAVSTGPRVGVDVGSRRRVRLDPLGAAAAVFSRRECELLAFLPAVEQAERFLALWTRREAIARAAGQGLLLPLYDVSVSDDSRWRVTMIPLTEDHLAAIAVEAPDGGGAALHCEEEMPPIPAGRRWRPPAPVAG
jgi:4'-phosphopantetheinyl transferase